MKVLITGGAGYLGSRLTQDLCLEASIDEIIIYDNLSRKNYNAFLAPPKLNKIRFVEGEILDSRMLNKVMLEVDVVVHLAAKVTTPFADQDPHLFEQVNHWGTAEVVYAAEKCDLQRFIYTSSASVYGATSEEVGIGFEPQPRTFYGISKLRGEEHVQRLSEKMSATIIRCGNVFGYDRSMRFDTVINRFAFEAHFKKRIRVHGSGDQRRSFVHIETVGQILKNAVVGNMDPSTYDLVEQTYSVNDLAEVFKTIYPDLDMLYMNQHMPMRELIVRPDQRLQLDVQEDLKGRVEAILGSFSY